MIQFDKNKPYFIAIERNGKELFFTATQIEITGQLISFVDKYNQQFVFPLENLKQANEVEK